MNSKKRDIKNTVKSAAAVKEVKEEKKDELEQKHRMGLNFNLFIGDDTGLIKKVRMLYSYQTDIVGSMSTTDKCFKEDNDETAAEDRVSEEVRKQRQEDFSTSTKFDADGQPLFKVMTKAINAKQTAKYGSQVKN